jgi:hypothetical protein
MPRLTSRRSSRRPTRVGPGAAGKTLKSAKSAKSSIGGKGGVGGEQPTAAAEQDTFDGTGEASLPSPAAGSRAGTTARRFTLKAPSDIPLELPPDLSPEVEAAARHLYARYADATSRELLNDAMAEPAFDMIIDMIPDEQRPGRLMGAIPLDEAPLWPPLPPLSAAVLCVATGTEHKVDDPLSLLEKALKTAGDVDVLLAPEWLFVPKGRLHTAAEAEAIIAKLKELSAGRDGLLVPGTIAWVDDDGGYHNTAVALSDGEVTKRVDKQHDGDDVAFAKDHGATYARGDGHSVFVWRDRRVGLEICRDHGDARLRWDLEDDAVGGGRRTVDLQLVVSCGVELKHPAVGVGGACLLANGDATSPAGMAQVGRRVPREDGMYKAYSPVAPTAPTKAHDLGRGVTLQTFTV